MKLKLKKSKGSSLIFVISVFSILIILGVSVLSLTLGAYKNRFVESTEKRNLYFSEAGLDLAYAEINKNLKDAVNQGNDAVAAYMNDLNNILDSEREKIKNGESSDYLNANGLVKEDYVKEKQNEFFRIGYDDLEHNHHDGYWKYVLDEIDSSDWKDEDGVNIIPIEQVYDNSKAGIISKPRVTFNVSSENISSNKIEFIKGTENKYFLKLQLQSTFLEKSVQKSISVDCSILTPDYNESYYVETNTVNLYDYAVCSKAICIDGDLKIKGGFTVYSSNGGVYARGTDPSTGGIFISGDSSGVEFNGDLSTEGKFQVTAPDISSTKPDSNNIKKITLYDNAYTGNFKIGEEVPETNEVNPSNIDIQVNGFLCTNNDLVINGIDGADDTNNHITIEDGFYGINDVRKLNDTEDITRVSSSIRLNTDDVGKPIGSGIEIKKEAIVMGTAYINTKPDAYQTGESVSIKGNYRAYLNPLTSSEYTKYEISEDENGNLKLKTDQDGTKIERVRVLKDKSGNNILDAEGNKIYVNPYLDDNNTIADYLNPLTLFARFKIDTSKLPYENKLNYEDRLNYEDKMDYFRIYYDQYGSSSDLNLGGEGVKVPTGSTDNYIHIGSVVSNGRVYLGNYMGDTPGKVIDMQNKFAAMVYELGDTKDLTEGEDSTEINDILNNIYENPNNYIQKQKGVYNQVNFGGIQSDDSKSLSSLDKVYLSKDKDYVIVGQGVDKSKLSDEEKLKVSNSTEISLDNTGTGKGIIITGGNVYLIGAINFTGTIIAKGNLEVLDELNKTLTYDSNYIKLVIASNYVNFKDLFLGNQLAGPFPYEANQTSNNNNAENTNLVKDKLIRIEKWRIMK